MILVTKLLLNVNDIVISSTFISFSVDCNKGNVLYELFTIRRFEGKNRRFHMGGY